MLCDVIETDDYVLTACVSLLKHIASNGQSHSSRQINGCIG